MSFHTLGESHRELPRECVVCGKVLDAAAQLDGDDAPEPGDISVCAYCGAPMRFTETGFELIPADEVAEIEREMPAFGVLRAAVAHMRRQGR